MKFYFIIDHKHTCVLCLKISICWYLWKCRNKRRHLTWKTSERRIDLVGVNSTELLMLYMRTFYIIVTYANYVSMDYYNTWCFMKCFIVWQIKEESFLEDINNLLNSGEIPNIFSADEKGDICEKMRELDKQRDKSVQVWLFINCACTNAKIHKHHTVVKNAILACVLLHALRIISWN